MYLRRARNRSDKMRHFYHELSSRGAASVYVCPVANIYVGWNKKWVEEKKEGITRLLLAQEIEAAAVKALFQIG
jgi:hypothetical protein